MKFKCFEGVIMLERHLIHLFLLTSFDVLDDHSTNLNHFHCQFHIHSVHTWWFLAEMFSRYDLMRVEISISPRYRSCQLFTFNIITNKRNWLILNREALRLVSGIFAGNDESGKSKCRQTKSILDPSSLLPNLESLSMKAICHSQVFYKQKYESK
jgi:hypothetical protein